MLGGEDPQLKPDFKPPKKFEFLIITQAVVANMNVNRKKTDPKVKPWGFTEVFNFYGDQGWDYAGTYNEKGFVLRREKHEN